MCSCVQYHGVGKGWLYTQNLTTSSALCKVVLTQCLSNVRFAKKLRYE